MDTQVRRRDFVNTATAECPHVRTPFGVEVDRDQALDSFLDRRDRMMRLSRFYGQVEAGLGRREMLPKGEGQR
jgi:hypothetical protein